MIRAPNILDKSVCFIVSYFFYSDFDMGITTNKKISQKLIVAVIVIIKPDIKSFLFHNVFLK